MKETDIRPNRLMQGQLKHIAADRRRLLQRKKDFVHVSCPACRVDSAHLGFEKEGFSYVSCSNCETMYVNPRPTPATLEECYAKSKVYWYWNKYIFPASEQSRREKIFKPRAERIADICKRYDINNTTLLDVGAGFGTFCEEATRLGIFHRVIAVEPNANLAETCRHRGLEVIEKPIEQVHFEQDIIDIVVSFETIEHLFSPQDFLNDCASVLSLGGLLIITCPNVKGFDINVLKALSSSVDHEHLNYFHPGSLSNLAKECGFEVLEMLTPGKLDAELVRKKILTGELDVSSRPFLKQVLIDEWERAGDNFQQFLADNLMSSHMWLVARKLE